MKRNYAGKGESAIKIHVDCGQTYEPGWHNVDGLGTETTLGESKGPAVLCNGYRLPLNGQAEFIRVWRVLERLNDNQLPEFLADVQETLAPNGRLEVKIIDHDPALAMAKAYPELNRVMFGPHKSYTWHIRKWTEAELIEYISMFGLDFVDSARDSVEYPSFTLRFVKPKSLAAKEYAYPHGRIKTGDNVLEIGPGRYPLAEARTYFDIDESFLVGLDGRKVVGDLAKGLPFNDKEFDYVFCSHVLEHIKDIGKAAAEISRVAHAGTLILPSIYKEFLFGFEEDDHVWEALYGTEHGLFVKARNPAFVNLFDKDYKSVMCKMFRAGRYDLHERRILHNWFRRNEPQLDVIVHWTDNFKVFIV